VTPLDREKDGGENGKERRKNEKKEKRKRRERLIPLHEQKFWLT